MSPSKPKMTNHSIKYSKVQPRIYQAAASAAKPGARCDTTLFSPPKSSKKAICFSPPAIKKQLREWKQVLNNQN